MMYANSDVNIVMMMFFELFLLRNVFIYFLFLSDEGPMLETFDYTVLSLLAVHRPFYISICISTMPMQHTTFI